MSPGQSFSLLNRLFAAVAGPISILAIILGLGGYVFIHVLAESTSDRVLQGSLTSIAETLTVERGTITLDLPPAAFGMLQDPEQDNVYYSIRHGSELVTGYPDLPAVGGRPPRLDRPTFRTMHFRGGRIRIAALARHLPRVADPVIVEVAETMAGRDKLELRLVSILVGLEALLMLGAVIIMPPAFFWALRPMDVLREGLATRTANRSLDLSPLPVGRAPRELRPFVEAFNELLRQLAEMTERMRRFTADASHQMRTPLATLKLNLEAARRPSTPEAGVRRALDDVEAAAHRLERLLVQLLSIARAEETNQELECSPTELLTLIRTVAASRVPEALRSGLEVRFEDDAVSSVMVETEPLILQEALGNLVDNAIRHNQPGGHVILRLGCGEGLVSIHVDDDGPGIPAAQREYVFGRFSRLSRAGSSTGSGLGLSISRELLLRVGGRVELSDPPGGGRGLRATIVLPLRPSAPADGRVAASPSAIG